MTARGPVVACLAALCLTIAATSAAQEIPPPEPEVPPRDSFALKVGFLNSWLFDSNQGRPFTYLDFGLRLKTDEFYIDVKLPAFVAGIDFLLYQLQVLLGVNSPFNLFEAVNQPIHYAAYLEPANVRLGQTFVTRLGGERPLKITAGIFTLFDFVFFDLALAQQDPEEFEDVSDPNANDPFVVAVGGFVAIGSDLPYSEWDLALGVGPDIFQDDSYVPNGGFVIFADLDLQIDPLRDVGAYLRTRLSTYTHTSPIVWTMTLSYGVALKLL